MIFGIIMSFIMLIWGNSIVSIFIDSVETEVIRYGTMYIRMLSIVYVFVTYSEVAFGVIKGRGKPHIPMILSIIGTWCIRVPLAWILVKQFGFFGICLAIPIAWTTTFLMTVVYETIMAFKERKRRMKFGKQKIA